jgi:serine/threonine protein kinase
MSNYDASIEDAEEYLKIECHRRLRSLSMGSAIFSESNSILASETSVHTVSLDDVQAGQLIGSGGFSNILEVRTLKPRSDSVDTVATAETEASAWSLHSQESIPEQYQHYALKKIRTDLPDSMEACGRIDLAVEAQFLTTLQHPNIVSFYGAGEEPGNRNFFIIMERIDRTLGSELDTWRIHKERLNQRSGLSVRDKMGALTDFYNARIAIAYQLTSALTYLHHKKILFRDLKPANVGLDFQDKIKLFDFGLAKELKDEFREGQNQYRATKKTGSLRYMAPEVFSEAGLYGLPADVYSFVLILWEVMSLTLPFNGMSADEHSVSTYVKKLRPKINKSWPNAMKRLIKDGWHHNPSRRPNMPTVFFEIASYLGNQTGAT